ncbi:uncharacterized protein LOC122510035 [Leptopilina heterotoma]|uniref:uncharacterized protein LOC122510035 n=1 Tax=Leptopilina heterotoma TaxID=63436 RepID=UPI001CA82D29|nr:uncharacterized protein LOC122510035 [Leptopilina heterotoma]
MFWTKARDVRHDQTEQNEVVNLPKSSSSNQKDLTDNNESILLDVTENSNVIQEKKRVTPAQDRLKDRIRILNSEIVALTVRNNVNFLSYDENAELVKKKGN